MNDDVVTISKEEASSMVRDYKGGTFFSVSFIKRGDGSLRVMNCRKGVKKDVSGQGHRYNVDAKGLVCVRDVKIQKHRMISLEGIKAVSMRGKKYRVDF